jgi:hypothetical protein
MNYNQLPIRSKVEVAEDIGFIIHCLADGKLKAANHKIEELKNHSIYLDEQVQGDVLEFSEAVDFQSAYDPWHLVTPEIQKAADRLIEDLGFIPPKETP